MNFSFDWISEKKEKPKDKVVFDIVLDSKSYLKSTKIPPSDSNNKRAQNPSQK